MKSIKFSHIYTKMCEDIGDKPPSKALLMAVFTLDSADLHPRFVEYDTHWFNIKENKWNYFKLPTGRVIVLLLRSETNGGCFMWTTIRRYTPVKFEYYRKNIWQEFNIVVMEDGA